MLLRTRHVPACHACKCLGSSKKKSSKIVIKPKNSGKFPKNRRKSRIKLWKHLELENHSLQIFKFSFLIPSIHIQLIWWQRAHPILCHPLISRVRVRAVIQIENNSSVCAVHLILCMNIQYLLESLISIFLGSDVKDWPHERNWAYKPRGKKNTTNY